MDLMDYRRKIIMSSPHLSHAEGAVASFGDGTDLPLKSLIVDIDPVQSGSGDPSPSNIRPISGWSAANVTGTGKNLLDPSLFKEQSAWNLIVFTVKPNTVYTASTNKPSGTGLYSYFNNTGSQGGGSSTDLYSSHPVTITSSAEGKVYIAQRRASGTDLYQNYQWQIEEGSTATPYEPYTGTSLTISLGQTVYGGTLNVLTGELVADMAIVDLGTLTWFYISQSGKERFYSSGIKNLVKKPAANTDNANIISSAYETFNVTHAFEKDKIIAIYTDGDILLRDTSYTDSVSLKTALSGVMLVYELATPLTYTLDPQTVRSLVGNNNIFADTGNVALDYWAHP